MFTLLFINKGAASLVQLGQRIFVVGGNTKTAEEFNLITKTWSVVPTPQIFKHGV
jgi:hypothetical protein